MVKAAQFIGRERSPLGDEVINNAVKRVSIMLFENAYQNDDLNWEYELKDLSVGYVSKFGYKNNFRSNKTSGYLKKKMILVSNLRGSYSGHRALSSNLGYRKIKNETN